MSAGKRDSGSTSAPPPKRRRRMTRRLRRRTPGYSESARDGSVPGSDAHPRGESEAGASEEPAQGSTPAAGELRADEAASPSSDPVVAVDTEELEMETVQSDLPDEEPSAETARVSGPPEPPVEAIRASRPDGGEVALERVPSVVPEDGSGPPPPAGRVSAPPPAAAAARESKPSKPAAPGAQDDGPVRVSRTISVPPEPPSDERPRDDDDDIPVEHALKSILSERPARSAGGKGASAEQQIQTASLKEVQQHAASSAEAQELSDIEAVQEDMIASEEPVSERSLEPVAGDSDAGALGQAVPPEPPDVARRSSPRPPAQQAAEDVAAEHSAVSVSPAPPPLPQAAPQPPAPPTGRKALQRVKRQRQWWEQLFSDQYLSSVIPPTVAQIARQCDFLQASLGLEKGATILDVGCGIGLQAVEFARRGFLVVGLDLSLPMITRAAEEAQSQGLKINFLHADIREIEFEGSFDAVLCLGTTFGFFDDDSNLDVANRLHAALRPGGRLLLDVVNRDFVVRNQPNLVWFQGDGCVCMEETDFNFFTSRLQVKRTMMHEDSGQSSEAEYSIRLYSLHELGKLLHSAGFRVLEVSGQEATRGYFFGQDAPRLIMLAETRAREPNGGGERKRVDTDDERLALTDDDLEEAED